MEFGGSSRALESSLRANSPNDFLNTWPLVVKDTRVVMLPDLPCDQNYQGVESFTYFLGDSCNQSLPPPREMRHSRQWCKLQQPQLLSKLVERRHNPLANGLLFHALDHIGGRTLDGVDSSLLGDRLPKLGYEPLTR
jgi:hypothetical protein